MPRQSDREYLLGEQYSDASNLDARAALHQRFSTNPYGWHRWVFDRFDVARNADLLELGSGPGTFWLHNWERIPPDWRVTLSDFSAGMVRISRRHLHDKHFSYAFALADAQAIPFRSSSFDAVIANHMLYHVPNLEKALSEIRRVLRANGRLYAATNGVGNMKELWELVAQATPQGKDRSSALTHNFNLENAQVVLRNWFSEVILDRYDDSLVVTDAEALVAYVESAGYLDADGIAGFAKRVTDRIGQDLEIHITKDTGLLTARN